MEYKIACVIVTYNRKSLLKRCLDAVDAQTYKPQVVYITDNASTDGTMDSVKEWGYYNCERNGIVYKYILNSKNEGGAGGFYLGMKTAFETENPDALWVMDDDGTPDKNCLYHLSMHLHVYDFISPMVISMEDDTRMAFWDDTVDDFKSKSQNHIVRGQANPFNGVLFSKTLIEEIGYPKKDMFIWGDEANYQARALVKGFVPVTCTEATHIHPKDRQRKIRVYKNGMVLVDIPDWKLYCYIRNITYNTGIGASFPRRVYRLIRFLLPYFIYYRKKIVYQAVWHGLRSDFNKLVIR